MELNFISFTTIAVGDLIFLPADDVHILMLTLPYFRCKIINILSEKFGVQGWGLLLGLSISCCAFLSISKFSDENIIYIGIEKYGNSEFNTFSFIALLLLRTLRV